MDLEAIKALANKLKTKTNEPNKVEVREEIKLPPVVETVIETSIVETKEIPIFEVIDKLDTILVDANTEVVNTETVNQNGVFPENLVAIDLHNNITANSLCECNHLAHKHDRKPNTTLTIYTMCNESGCDCMEFKVTYKVIQETVGELVDNEDKEEQARLIGEEERIANLTDEELELEEISKDYKTTVTELDIFRKHFVNTCRAVAGMTITELQEKIEKCQETIKIATAIEQACRTTQSKKLKDESPAAKEKRLKDAASNKKHKEDVKKGKNRINVKVDKHGVIKSPPKSKREKIIENLMKTGMTREKAEKLVDE